MEIGDTLYFMYVCTYMYI